MSKENVEAARALDRLWNEGVRSIRTEYFDPAVELESPFSSVSGEPYRGHAGMTQWVRDVDEQFAEWRTCLSEVREVGDAVLMTGVLQGRGRGSGIEIETPFGVLLDFEAAHRITRVRIYWDLDEARRAAGPEG